MHAQAMLAVPQQSSSRSLKSFIPAERFNEVPVASIFVYLLQKKEILNYSKFPFEIMICSKEFIRACQKTQAQLVPLFQRVLERLHMRTIQERQRAQRLRFLFCSF